jgi:phosphoribosylanthranilate isomerase
VIEAGALLVKVCGLTTAEDAGFAADAGADLLGFVFHPPSPRHCGALREASRDVRDRAVLVMVSDDPVALARTAAMAGLHRIQPHCARAARRRVAEALSKEGFDLLLPWPDEAGQEAVDGGFYLWEPGAANTGLEGGSGQANPLGFPPPGPFLLAGGLDGTNLAVRAGTLAPALRPLLRGFDAASRLELSPGRKDPEKVRAYIQAAKAHLRGGTADAV